MKSTTNSFVNNTETSITRFRPRLVLFAVLAITAVGAGLRFAGLNRLSMMMDTIWIYDLCRNGVRPSDMMTRWLEVGGAPGTIPFSVLAAAAFLRLFRIPVTFPALVVPFALWGTASIPIAFGFGLRLGGIRLGLTLAMFLAMNPIMAQISREAYFYSPALFGIMTVYWASAILLDNVSKGRIPWYFHVVNAAGVFVMTYSSPSTWSNAAVLGAMQFGLLAWSVVRRGRNICHLLLLIAIYIAIALPLILSEWGLRNMLEFTAGPVKEYWQKVFRFSSGRTLSQLLVVWRQCLWGTTPLRTFFSFTVVAAGVWNVAVHMRRDKRWRWLSIAAGVILCANLLALKQSLWGIDVRYFAGVLPFYFAVVCFGLVRLVDLLGRFLAARLPRLEKAAVLFYALPILLWIEPAWHVTNMTGQPIPFREIAEFADRELPAGAPVLTDRFFTAYNEFRAHPTTNVMFISLGRNQIREEYQASRFRERATQFMIDNPVSGFYEEEHLWLDSSIGPWEWPHKFYKRSKAFSDPHSVALYRVGQSLRGGGVRRFYYNLPEDIVFAAHSAGAQGVALYGAGWSATQTSDFSFWRVMGTMATLDVYNLSSVPKTLQVELVAASPRTEKHVEIDSSARVSIPPNRPVVFRTPPREFGQGLTSIVLRDPSPSARESVLLVRSLKVLPAEPLKQAGASPTPGEP